MSCAGWNGVIYIYKMVFHISCYSYGISENGSHAGAVIYSDFGSYSMDAIRFDDHYSTPEFLRAVEAVEHFGFRTRIDLAFQRAETKLFVKEGGMGDDFGFYYIGMT